MRPAECSATRTADPLHLQMCSALHICKCSQLAIQTAFMLITSKQNDLIKFARAVRIGHERGMLFIEGTRLCEEAIKSKLTIQTVISLAPEELTERSRRVLAELVKLTHQVVFVSNSVFKHLSDLDEPQGVIVLAQLPKFNKIDISFQHEAAALILVLHNINNPNNAGALLRTAEAAGVNGIVATQGTTNLLSCKALRGSMGAVLRLPILQFRDFNDVIVWCRQKKLQIVCSDIRAASDHLSVNWKLPTALIMGSEAHGLEPSEVVLTDVQFKIPMVPEVDSLNVAVAAGISLYEAVRQRNSPTISILDS